MGALSKLSSYPNKVLAFFVGVLPKVIRVLILGIWMMWKHYRLVSTNHKLMSTIDSRSSKFSYGKRTRPELDECSICLSWFEDGEEGREVVECKHAFHRGCLEKWLLQMCSKATCPLCRSLVVPDEIAAEYSRVQTEQEGDNWIEKELALILLNTFHGGSSCSGFSFIRRFC